MDSSFVMYNLIKANTSLGCIQSCAHCTHAGTSQSDIKYLHPQFLQKTVQNILTKWPAETSLVLTGGEPADHPELQKILDSFYNINLQHLILATNGESFLKGSRMDTLIRSKTDYELYVSLDGDAARHNAIRNNKQSFDRVIEFLKSVRSANAVQKISVNLLVTTDYKDWLIETCKLFQKLDVNEIRLIPMTALNRKSRLNSIAFTHINQVDQLDIELNTLNTSNIPITINKNSFYQHIHSADQQLVAQISPPNQVYIESGRIPRKQVMDFYSEFNNGVICHAN
jgi:molybdenum cofactor biosynthesis enzyme MoaA